MAFQSDLRRRLRTMGNSVQDRMIPKAWAEVFLELHYDLGGSTVRKNLEGNRL
jgi:hypothetical protein